MSIRMMPTKIKTMLAKIPKMIKMLKMTIKKRLRPKEVLPGKKDRVSSNKITITNKK